MRMHDGLVLLQLSNSKAYQLVESYYSVGQKPLLPATSVGGAQCACETHKH